MTFSEQIVYAMFKASKYKELLSLKKKRFVLFASVLSLMLSFVLFVIPSGAMIAGMGGFENLFVNQISEMKYTDGELKIKKPFELSLNLTHVLIDTKDEVVSDEKLGRDGMYLAVGSKTIRMCYVIEHEVIEYKLQNLDELLVEGFDNRELCKLIPYIYLYMVVYFLINAISIFIKYALVALVYSICINSVNMTMNLGLSFGQVFKLCYYGQTMGIILVNFNAALGLLPELLVSIIGIFISVHMITKSTVLMGKKNQD